MMNSNKKNFTSETSMNYEWSTDNWQRRLRRHHKFFMCILSLTLDPAAVLESAGMLVSGLPGVPARRRNPDLKYVIQ